MEGPTPVSALVHSARWWPPAFYLAGRFFPVFTGEVLLVIAYVGAITLFMAATIAITAVDIKRVLAYSTVSQLGYMMLGIGLGGWAAGLFHLVTHAFFKSLLFMCSGSVIHATHTNDMASDGRAATQDALDRLHNARRRARHLRRRHPVCGRLQWSLLKRFDHRPGAFVLGSQSTAWRILAGLAIAGSGITAFYMFRMWFMTFAGKPRDHHVYEHVHESPPVMYIPLVVLSVLPLPQVLTTRGNR